MISDGRGAATLPGDNKSAAKGLITGTLVAYAITCAAFVICAVLLRYTSFSEEDVPAFVTAVCILSVVISGFDAARPAARRGWLWGLAAGLVYAVLWVFCGVLFTETFSFDSRTLTVLALSVAGGGLGGVIGINFRKR